MDEQFESAGRVGLIPVVRVFFASLMRLCVTKNLTQIPVYDSIWKKETREIKRLFWKLDVLQRSRRGTHKPEGSGSIPLPATILEHPHILGTLRGH